MAQRNGILDTLEQMSRTEKVALYCLCTLEGLVKKGILERDCNGEYVAPLGWELFAAMKETGFRPTDQERDEALRYLASPRSPDDGATER